MVLYRKRFAGTRWGRAWWTRTRRPRRVRVKRPKWPRRRRRPRTGTWPDTRPWRTARAPTCGVQLGRASAVAGHRVATAGRRNPPTTCSAPAARPAPTSCWGGGPVGLRRLWASWWSGEGERTSATGVLPTCSTYYLPFYNIGKAIFFLLFTLYFNTMGKLSQKWNAASTYYICIDFTDCSTVCRWARATLQRTDDWADCSRGTGSPVAGGLRSCRTCPSKKKNNNNESLENGWGSRWVCEWCVCAWCEREREQEDLASRGDNGSRSPCVHFFLPSTAGECCRLHYWTI